VTQSNLDPLQTSARVLIVDDDPLARETLSALLRREGHTLLFAGGGQEVLEQLPTLAPDLLLLDVVMPGMTGFEVCRAVKAQPAFGHVPIILVTGLDDRVDLVRGLDAGADEFIAKPVNSLELKARVRSLLRMKQQYDALQSALRTRDLLSNMIAHDMRNPLAAVQLYVQLLKRNNNLPPEQVKYLDLIYNEAHHATTFLDDIQLISKLEQGRVALTRSAVDLDRLLNEVREKVAPLLQARPAMLVIDGPPQPPERIVADRFLVQRVLEHVLAQAIKAAPGQTEILLRAEYPRQQTGDLNARQVRIRIQHSGAHIPPADLPRLFDREAMMTIQPLKSLTSLGLAYSKMVIDAHGGAIFAENVAPRGVAFIVEL
jgi:DNA-binding response OmpR family regulator